MCVTACEVSGSLPKRTVYLLNRTEATGFFQVVNRRYEIGDSTIVITNRGYPNGARSSATPSSPTPWTGSCTKPSCSRSNAPSWRMKEHQALTSPSIHQMTPTHP
jgi:hypothetical protein